MSAARHAKKEHHRRAPLRRACGMAPAMRRSKRKAAPGEPGKRSRTQHERSSLDSIRALLRDFEATAPATGVVWICLETVLDSTPFGAALQQHGPPECLPKDSLPLVTRAYEEAYMRECHLPEDTPCVMGEFCECQSMGGFCGVAFVLPHVSAMSPRMCVLCIRKTTQMLFYRIVVSGMSTTQMIQFYGNIAGVPGEYHESAMLVVPPSGPVHCMPLPVVAHQRNRYRAHARADGVRRIAQQHVYFEDFH